MAVWQSSEGIVFEVSKPGFFKRFVECSDIADALWLGQVIAPLGCMLQRIDQRKLYYVSTHYDLPADTARAMLELTAYYSQANGEHTPGELDGRIGDRTRQTREAIQEIRGMVLTAPQRKKP